MSTSVTYRGAADTGMTEPVRLRVRKHGAHQVEFKIDYDISAARETRYTVNTYIFVPHTLGINNRTYFNIDFHRDIQNYVRMRTPLYLLDDLASDPNSPLAVVENILEHGRWETPGKTQDRLITNIKLLRPVLNASLREHLRRAVRRKRQSGESREADRELERALADLVTSARAFVDRYRLLEERLSAHGDADGALAAYRYVDEAVSLVYEDALVWAFQIAQRDLAQGRGCRDALGAEIAKEVEYRRRRKYRSVLRDDSSNERFLETTSFLKKYTTSALYLSSSTEREGTTLEQISFAIAAGLSMVFATVVAFYYQARYGVLTFPFFVALVVGYMFKDRIKEIGRDLSAKMVRNLRYDQRTTLYSPDGKDKIGYLREKMTFIDHAAMPQVIRSYREGCGSPMMDLDDQDEEIICYAKEVAVRSAASGRFDVVESRIAGIRDIMRYDIRRYLRKTADPIEERYMLVNGDLVAVDCHKTYRLEFVTEYRSWNEDEPYHYHHSVVYLDRDGITAVRHVG